MKSKKSKQKKNKSNRYLVIYTPNYMVTPNKVVYDSSNNTTEFDDVIEAVIYYENLPAQDAHIEYMIAYDDISNKEILKYLDTVMLLSTPKSMYYTDLGIIARNTMNKIKELMTEFNAEVQKSNDFNIKLGK